MVEKLWPRLYLCLAQVSILLGLFACADGGGGGGADSVAACEADVDCRTGRHCVSGECQVAAIACVMDDECPPTLLCSNSGCRRQACTDVNQCHVGYACGDDGFCRKADACLTDADCPGGTCDTFTHACSTPIRSGCGDASMCPAGTSCVDEVCVSTGEPTGCETDSECRPGTWRCVRSSFAGIRRVVLRISPRRGGRRCTGSHFACGPGARTRRG